jgi:DoxX
MNILTVGLIGWPERVAQHLKWLAPLFARIVVGWVFMWSGWGKLHNLPAITENFISWHIPAPHILTPFVSGVEFFGGIFLLVGLITRISAGALGVTWILWKPCSGSMRPSISRCSCGWRSPAPARYRWTGCSDADGRCHNLSRR